MHQEPKKVGPFTKIKSREDALKVMQYSSGSFFVLAAILGGIGVFLTPSMLIDAAILAMLAAILRTWKSRVAAVLLLLMSLGIVITTTLTKLGISKGVGSNIFLAVIVLWVAIRAVQATFLLHGRFAESKDSVI
ncbi:MAG: hypothetical protein ACKO45_02120 [Cyanobium sp.]